jgi:hypothetical protein
MVPSRTLAVIVAAAASLSLLGGSLMNLTAVRRLRLSLPDEPGIPREPDDHITALEEEIESIQAGIDEELGRYGDFDQQDFLELVETILKVFTGNAISMSHLDIWEREGTESLEINGEGSITDILRSLDELPKIENPLLIETMAISEGRDRHEVSLIIRPAPVPDYQESEDRATVVAPGREISGTPLDWARHLFGYKPPAAVPRPTVRESAPDAPAVEEPPLPGWIAFIGRFRAENGKTEYAFRDDRDGRIRLITPGMSRRGWRLVEDGAGFVVLEIDENRYRIEVPR